MAYGEQSRKIETLFSAQEIDQRIASLANDIAAADLKDLLVIAILKGSFVFAADLIRALHKAGLNPEMDFLSLASYGARTESSGQVTIIRDIDSIIKDRNILIIDDILESGRTLAFAKDLITARGANQVRTCVLLNKDIKRAIDIEADYYAFSCPDVFVIGYGMDLAHKFRELPYVGRLITDESKT